LLAAKDTTMEKLKVLVLGTGFFGKNWLRELSACGDCEVAGLVGKHPELLTAAGEEFGVPAARRFATITDGLDRAGAQAVVVALPEMVHKDAILAALARGLHVLTEKPLAMTMAEAGEIVRAARLAPASVVMVDQNYRWRPQTRTLRQAVRDGQIGAIGSIGYEYRQPITRATTDAWRETMPHPFLHDMAPHHFDLLRACTGLECEQVVARGVRPSWNWYQGVPGVDAILSFERGVSASYTGTMVARGLATTQDGIITVVGEHGTLRLEADSRVRFYGEQGGSEVVPPVAMPFADLAGTLREFLAAIREGRKPETHLDDNVRTLAMVEAAIASVQTGQPVAVGPLVSEALRG
jgi:predicted dehydrogenase